MPDILFILVLALVIFGPKRLPEIARQVAKFVAQFRMMRDDLRRQLESEMFKIELEEKEKKAAVLPAQLDAGNPATADPQAGPSEALPQNPVS